MNPWQLGNRGAPADVDENFVGLQNFVVDHDRAGRLKAGMALDDRTIFKSSHPFFHAPVRPSGNCILARFDTLHIDAHVAADIKTIFGASASHMGRVRARNHRLCRDTSRIHTGAAKLVAFNNGDCHARSRKPRSQRRPCLAGPDDDCVVVGHCGSSSPVCSRTVYSAYQSDQFGSAEPTRFSCSPWAAEMRVLPN